MRLGELDLRRGYPLLLAGVLVFAAWARWSWCARGLPYLHVWDEPQTAATALAMMRTGDFDPHFFNYGSLMIYVDLVVDCIHALNALGSAPRTGVSLGAVGEVVIGADTGWTWEISHPAFYFWNRMVVAAMGVGTVALVAGLGRRVAGPAAGLAAAVVLAALPVHVTESARITNDAPVAFFVVLAAWCALRFREEERPDWLVGSLVACGLATGCKYNAGASVVLPLVALVEARARGGAGARGWLWPALGVVPAGTFVATTPFAVLDLPTFLNHVGYELRHYRVLGHGVSTVTPGWPHLRLQLGEMGSNLGPVAGALALVGAVGALGARRGWVLLVFPVAYAAFMTSTRVSFHRNFLVIYPFAAVAAGLAVERLVGAAARWPSRARRAGGLLLVGGALAWLGHVVPSARAARLPETRSAIVADLLAGPWQRIGLPAELRIHAVDLARLAGRDVSVAPLDELLCAGDREVVVVPAAIVSATDPARAARLTSLLPDPGAALVHGAPGKDALHLDEPSLDPQLRIVPGARAAACAP